MFASHARTHAWVSRVTLASLSETLKDTERGKAHVRAQSNWKRAQSNWKRAARSVITNSNLRNSTVGSGSNQSLSTGHSGHEILTMWSPSPSGSSIVAHRGGGSAAAASPAVAHMMPPGAHATRFGHTSYSSPRHPECGYPVHGNPCKNAPEDGRSRCVAHAIMSADQMPMWQWEDNCSYDSAMQWGPQWADYDAEIQGMLNKMEADPTRASCDAEIRGNHYTIDLKRMLQTNRTTKKERKIQKRVETSTSHQLQDVGSSTRRGASVESSLV